jgi:hypothetical protein
MYAEGDTSCPGLD